MTALLFEQFWWKLGIFVILWLICMTMYYQRRTLFWRRATIFSPPMFLLLLVINALVVTDREAIRNTLDEIIRACQDADMTAMRRLFDDSFDAGRGCERDQALARIERALEHVRVGQVQFMTLQIEPPNVKVESFCRVFVRPSDEQLALVKSSWTLEFVKRPNGWRLLRATPVTIMDHPVQHLIDVTNMASPY